MVTVSANRRHPGVKEGVILTSPVSEIMHALAIDDCREAKVSFLNALSACGKIIGSLPKELGLTSSDFVLPSPSISLENFESMRNEDLMAYAQELRLKVEIVSSIMRILQSVKESVSHVDTQFTSATASLRKAITDLGIEIRNLDASIRKRTTYSPLAKGTSAAPISRAAQEALNRGLLTSDTAENRTPDRKIDRRDKLTDELSQKQAELQEHAGVRTREVQRIAQETKARVLETTATNVVFAEAVDATRALHQRAVDLRVSARMQIGTQDLYKFCDKVKKNATREILGGNSILLRHRPVTILSSHEVSLGVLLGELSKGPIFDSTALPKRLEDQLQRIGREYADLGGFNELEIPKGCDVLISIGMNSRHLLQSFLSNIMPQLDEAIDAVAKAAVQLVDRQRNVTTYSIKERKDNNELLGTIAALATKRVALERTVQLLEKVIKHLEDAAPGPQGMIFDEIDSKEMQRVAQENTSRENQELPALLRGVVPKKQP